MENARNNSNSNSIEKSRIKKTNDIVAEVNEDFGRWQLRTILLIFLCKIPTAWFTTCIVYTAPTPERGDIYCKTNPLPNASYPMHTNDMSMDTESSLSTKNWRKIDKSNKDDEYRQQTDRHFRITICNIYEEKIERQFSPRYSINDGTKDMDLTTSSSSVKIINIIPCQEFEFNTVYQSLITQFDLVCSRQVLIMFTQLFHGFGALCGGIFAVRTMKYISPRRLMLYGMWFQIVCGILTGIVTRFPVHVFFRCLTSFCCALMYTSGHVILTDITGGKAKTITVTLFELFWSIGLILLPGISIFFNNWSQLYVAISAPVLILVVLHRWIADSPRWLLQQNKIDSALKLLLESAAFNHREIPLNLESELKEYAIQLQSVKQQSYWSIWDGQTKRTFIYSVHWAFASASVIFNVMILLIRSMGIDHIHTNTVCLGFAEMLGVFIGLYFILFLRRCWLWTGRILIVAGIFTYFIWVVPQTIQENRRNALEFIFWMFLKFSLSVSLSVLTTCIGDLVTPEKRPILMLSVITFSRCLVTLGPLTTLLTGFHKHIPITLFATLTFINGILMCNLNRKFWNFDQLRIPKILTPRTYRRRLSSIPNLNVNNEQNGCYHNRKVSITDIWEMESIASFQLDELDNDNTLSTTALNDNKSIREITYI